MASDASSGRTEGGETARRALQLIDAVVAASEPLGLNDLVDTVGLSKSTCYRLPRILQEERYVDRIETGGYVVGSRLAGIAAVVLPQATGYQAARPALRKLAEATGETITQPPPRQPSGGRQHGRSRAVATQLGTAPGPVGGPGVLIETDRDRKALRADSSQRVVSGTRRRSGALGADVPTVAVVAYGGDIPNPAHPTSRCSNNRRYRNRRQRVPAGSRSRPPPLPPSPPSDRCCLPGPRLSRLRGHAGG